MKTLVLLLAALQHARAQQAGYGFDPRGAQDCIAWADIGELTADNTCEKTVREYGVEPVRFHAWNPSVGLDCKPWFAFTSYCVMTNETLQNAVYYTTTTISEAGGAYTLPLFSMATDSAGYSVPVTRSDASTRAYTSLPAVPSPGTWKETGCYVDTYSDEHDTGANLTWNLEFRYRPRDEKETATKCKQKCWEIQYSIAGVKGGDECWCGDRNNATRAADQSECNTPCGGDAKEKCGGTQRMNVWAADASGSAATATATTTGAGGSGSGSGATATGATATGSGAGSGGSGSAAATGSASSGAGRNRGFFGLL